MRLPTEEMSCKDLVELVTAYVEDALSAPDRARFEAHLTGCPYCWVYLEQMRQTIRLLGPLAEEALAPQVKNELLQRFRTWKAQSS